jgi:tetratricopeptide (TPR) repeat protein
MTAPRRYQTSRRLHRLLATWATAGAVLASLIPATPIATAQQERSWDQPAPGQEPRRPRREREPAEREKASPGEKSATAEPKPIPGRMRAPGATSVPEGGAERARLLAELYARLATAADDEVARRIANAIEHVWGTSPSPTVSLLMERARRADAEKKPSLALRLLDRAAQLAPDYPEVFNRRAAVHFAQNNLQSSLGDLRRVLALDPNHYRALESLGQIFKDLGRKKAALEVYRRIMDIHPLMSGAKSTFEELEREAGGQPS